MEQGKTANRVLKFAAGKKETSCIIGNLFVEIEPPCCVCKLIDELKIYGTTYLGTKEVLIVKDYGFDYSGNKSDIETLREKRCLID